MMRGFLLSGLVLALVAGCSVGGVAGTESASPQPIVPEETESEVLSPEDEAVAVYLQFWDAIVLASAEMDPDHPGLAEHATGQALELSREGVQAVADGGHGMEGAPVPAPEVVSVEPEDGPNTIVVRDCQSAGDWRVIGEAEPRSDNVRVDARIQRDVFDWWVTELQIWGEDSC